MSWLYPPKTRCEWCDVWRLTTTPGSTSPTLFEQWRGFFYVSQEPDKCKCCETWQKDNTVRCFDNLPSVRLWASSLDDLWGRLSLRHKWNLTLVKPVCETAPKSFFGPPPVYQHLSTCHNWSAKNATHDFLPSRIKGNSKRIFGNSFSPFGANQN